MNDGAIDIFLAASNLISGRGTPDDAAAVVRALAMGALRANEAVELRARVSSEERNLRAVARQLDDLSDARSDDRRKARAAIGDGCVALRCGGRLLIEGGKPTRLHDGDPHAQFRDERRSLAVEQASAIWGEELEVVGGWGEDGEAALDFVIPF